MAEATLAITQGMTDAALLGGLVLGLIVSISIWRHIRAAK